MVRTILLTQLPQMKMGLIQYHLKHKKAHIIVAASYVPNLGIKLDVILHKKTQKNSFINYRPNVDTEKVSAQSVQPLSIIGHEQKNIVYNKNFLPSGNVQQASLRQITQSKT